MPEWCRSDWSEQNAVTDITYPVQFKHPLEGFREVEFILRIPRNHILTHSPVDRNSQDSQQTQPCLNQLLVAVLEVVRKERIVNGFKPFVLMAGHLCQALFGDIGGDS